MPRWVPDGHAGGKDGPGHVSDARRNPSTWASVDELIALRRHACRLTLKGNLPACAQLAGNHPSRFRGRGMDYQESRAYQAGDDIRNMDWRVTARSGRPHTKLFQEERERPVVFCVDLSASLYFASHGSLKSVVAARAVALLAWTAAAQGDRIGALLFDDDYHELRPRAGHRGVLPLIRALVDRTDPIAAQGAVSKSGRLGPALIRLHRIARPGSLVFIVGDFSLATADDFVQLARLRIHNDVVALHVVDALEIDAPPNGRYPVHDGSQHTVLDLRSEWARQQYSAHCVQRHAELMASLVRVRVPLVRLMTSEPVDDALATRFASRAAAPARCAL